MWPRSNAYRANIYRPMPGEAAAEVTLTVTMQHKTKDVSVQKQITLKVLPLTKAELDDALNLMEQAKAHYWDGLNDGANESQYAVTKSLHAFREAVAGENGGLTWLYDYRDAHGAGIVARRSGGLFLRRRSGAVQQVQVQQSGRHCP